MDVAAEQGSPHKYATLNPISRWLVERFFRVAGHALPPGEIRQAHEIGCGEGKALARLRRAYPTLEWSASDVNPDLVTLAQAENPGVNIHPASVYELPFREQSFDVIVALEVFEHLERPSDALRELARVTRRYVLISVPHEPWWRLMNMLRGTYWRTWGNTPGHINHWSRAAFERFVGSELEVVRTHGAFPWTMVLARRRQ